MSQLGVGVQLSIDQQRGANSGAEGQHHDRSGASRRVSEPHFSQAGRIGVVQHGNFPRTQVALEKILNVRADPQRINIRRG